MEANTTREQGNKKSMQMQVGDPHMADMEE